MEKKIQNGRLKKNEFFKITKSWANSAKISRIGPWVSRIDWCEEHWCGSSYMAVRLSDLSSIIGKNAIFVFLGHFWAYVGEPHGHTGWATSMPFASINPTNPRTNPWNFGGNCSAFGDVEKLFLNRPFWILNLFFFIPMKICHKLCVRMDGTQFLLLWWFTAKNECRNDKIAWV